MPLTLDEALVDALVATVSQELARPVSADGWRPSVQGAVGHVVGLQGPDGQVWVAKVFGADDEGASRCRTEVAALRLAAPLAGVPVPEVVLDGLVDAGPSARRTPVVVMTRLPGVRWSDRRARLDDAGLRGVHDAVADLLRALHSLTGGTFGDLSHGGAGRPDAWARTRARALQALADYTARGGPAELADRARQHLEDRRELFDGVVPAFCHHDVNGGNVLLTGSGAPRVTGLVDFERASWDDPLRDVALTALHLAHHDVRHVGGLLDRYGLDDAAAHDRLQVHTVVLMLAERAWVAIDQPRGWSASARRLDGMLDQVLRR